jgi:hypothetical protein
MIIQVLHCPHCQGTDIVRHGTTRQGKQRYRCRPCRQGRGRTFLLDYSYAGQSPEIKEQVVFEIWTLPLKYAMLITSSEGRSHGADCCDVPVLSK